MNISKGKRQCATRRAIYSGRRGQTLLHDNTAQGFMVCFLLQSVVNIPRVIFKKYFNS